MPDATLHILDGAACSVVLETTATGELIWRHWGARVDAAALPPLAMMRTTTTFTMDSVVPLALVPTTGFGWFGPSGLRCHRDRRPAGQRLTVSGIAKADARLGAMLADCQGGVEVAVDLTVRDDCLVIATRLRNTGATPLSVDWLASAVLPLPPQADAIVSFTGRHTLELDEQREPMPPQGWYRVGRQGMTGHGGPPGLFVLDATADWHGGEVWAAQLAWSGNHRLQVEPDGADGWVAMLGAEMAPGEVVLMPGEELAAPEVLAAFSPAGRNGAIAAFHDAIRSRRVTGRAATRLVHFNSWESVYFDHDEARTIALAKRAAALGVERFVLDDGWFRGRADDRAGLGDWTADPLRYRRGLKRVAQRVAALGMDFGLWVEPEMVNPDSDLYRQHPEWVLGAGLGQTLPTARNQLVLDLGRPDVRDHLFGALSALLRTLPIGYLKWDHNRPLAPMTGADGREGGRAQLLGAWALWDRLRAAFPAVEMEACAAGGGRVDAGFAARADRFWTSDNIDAVSRVPIQRGFLHFMPPELMGAHVGASPAHATGRRQSMDFRAMVALPGHFGIELDPDRLLAGEEARLRAWVARYKALRERLHTGRTWLGEGADGLRWQAQGSPARFLLWVFRTAPARHGRNAALRLPMVAAAGAVRVRLIDGAGLAGPLPAVFDAQREASLPGGWLARCGLPLPNLHGEGAALFDVAAAVPSTR